MTQPTLDYRTPATARKTEPDWTKAVVVTIGCLLLLAFLVSLLLPSLGKARPAAQRVKCASNLRQIGTAIVLYANDHQGRLPPDFGTVLITQDLVSEVFCCPSTDHDRAPGTQPTEWVTNLTAGDHLSYVYVRQDGRLIDLADDVVLAYEPLRNHHDDGYDGMNVLFADGRVEWVDATIGRAIVARHAAGVLPVRPPSATP